MGSEYNPDGFEQATTIPIEGQTISEATFDYLISEIKTRRQAMERLQNEMDDLRAEYNEAVLLHGNYSSPIGKIELRKSSTSCSYDAKIVSVVQAALETISPALAAQLEGAKKITLRGETWSIK